VALPAGISFFTFQAIAYLTDVYRGTIPAERNPGRVALFMAFFPQILQGPILRYGAFGPALCQRREGSADAADGAVRFCFGLAKKVLLADALGQIADAAFASGDRLTMSFAWLGAVAYTLQLYFDFSGYTDMVARRLLAAESTPLQALVKKGILTLAEHTPTTEYGAPSFRLPTLTAHQQEALERLRADFAAGRSAALLHGVTGSGKTEVYIHLIAEVLAAGGDVLLLVPEIALTAQLIERMERIFGARLTAYHSRLTNHRRSENYLRLNRSTGGEFVVGVRSSIFLPLKNLQLIIVDEEHDASYKQAEPAPRYSARDVAVWMAHQRGARTLLGSATPSLETWLNATSGKYGHATLTERYGEAELPKIYLSDTRRAAQRGERHGHFNKLLIDKIEQTLARGEQVMLFQNRRGFAPYLECPECGWTARCPHCNVTLSYHKYRSQLICHYCGHTEQASTRCPSCKVVELQPMGFGTEKIEEQIAELFPEARVGRLDRDQLTSESAFNRIIDDFATHRTDILVGTQMITKGFDFEGVSLVGVLNADNLLLNPDFRASERAFQLLQQVAGRAGRRHAGGEVVIQTSDPANPLLRQVLNDDFRGMAHEQLADRQSYFYPPYARLTL
ncbi:MAG: primosomal protein N', partial [Alistipes sp.]|nr:primosomal protein N' [Alistipes sp.]